MNNNLIPNMEASQVNILDLNDYCLGRILKYLQIEDHVNFGETCVRLREVLRDWSYVLYPEFKINDEIDFKWKIKLFLIICDVIKKLYLTIDPNKMEFPVPDLFYNHIKTMQNLEFFAYKNEEFPILKRFKIANNEKNLMVEETLNALEHLPKIKSVSVRSTTRFKAHNMLQLKGLQEISLDAEITSEDLVDICKSNENLRVLWLRAVVGELSDIVPYCANLEEISFPMLSSHKSYVGLAELPNIKKVVIKSTNSTSPCAKLLELFNAFVDRKQGPQLQSVMVLSSLDFEETSKLIELKSLQELRCGFEDASCIDLLTDLTELEGLYIMLGRSAAGSKECLNVLKSCRKLQRLHINSNLSTEFLDKAVEVLSKVRNTEKQKPLQLYSTGLMHLCKEEEKLVDNAYCTVVNHSAYLRPMPWRLSS